MNARTIVTLLFTGALWVAALTGCEKTPPAESTGAETAPVGEPTVDDEAPEAKNEQAKPAADEENWFGGPTYTGEPNLEATAALIRAGGGPENFSFQTALVSMLGEETVNEEIKKLTEQYSEEEVNGFIKGMDFAVNDAIKRTKEAGIELPAPPDDLKGTKLAKALVQAGTAPDGTFWSGHLLDKALSHKIHNLVMADIDAKLGREADKNTHKILNQAMYDVAQALDMKEVKLASLH